MRIGPIFLTFDQHRGPPSGRDLLGYNSWVICMKAKSVTGVCLMEACRVSFAGTDIRYGMACAAFVAAYYESRMEYRDGLDARCSAKWLSL
jgi:hypothetical protein